jgi:FtsP/CotA-like multicopper oxidase with cupredoxin domain
MHRAGRMAALLAGGGGLSLLAAVGAVSIAQGDTIPSSGLVCTTSSTGEFTLTTRAGRVETPDGNTMYMWSFAPGDGGFQLPGPYLCVTEGQTVSVTLKNTLPEPVSVIFPGQTGVQADGSPTQPQDSGGQLTSLTTPATPGGQVTYSFVAAQPGTYLYESGTDMATQVQMGLFGALIVRPASDPGLAYNDPGTAFNPGTELSSRPLCSNSGSAARSPTWR